MSEQERAVVPWKEDPLSFYIRVRYSPQVAQAWSAAMEFQESMHRIQAMASTGQNEIQELSAAILAMANEQEGEKR